MISKVQPKPYNYRTNQTKKIQYTKNQIDQNQKLNNNNMIKNNNIASNIAYNNRIIQNNLNQNRNININYMNNNNNNNSNNISSTSNNTHNISNSNQTDELGKAILLIRRECKRKDDRIRDLEKKVSELTNKLNILLKNNKNSIELNDEYNDVIEYRPFSGSPTEKMNFKENLDGTPLGRDIRGYSIGYIGINHKNNPRSNSFMQSNSQNKINYNSDTEKMINKRLPGYDNLSHSNDHSVLTYNGGGSQTSTKADVKNYLKEVKSKIEPKKFKEFIRNIRLLTAKNNNSLNKDIIVESVRILFGDEYKDLFVKFQSIIGFKK